MTDHEYESINQPPPSDVERLHVLARLIHERVAVLHTARRGRMLQPDDARELYVLEWLVTHWLEEGAKRPG